MLSEPDTGRAAAPLVIGGAAVIGVGAVISGGAAGLGSVILLIADTQVLGAELRGDEAGVKRIEDIANDERILDLLKPEHGMLPDVKLEARVSGIHRAARR